MRIGLVIDHFDPSLGGQEKWTARLAQALSLRRHEVHVIARDFSDSFDALPIRRHALRGRGYCSFARRAELLLRALSLDIIHDTGAGTYCHLFNPHYGSRETSVRNKVLLLPGPLRPIKRLMIETLPRYRRFRALARLQYVDDGRLILALSQRVARDIERDYNVSPARIRVVYNGIDVERFALCSSEALRRKRRAQLNIADDTVAVLLIAHNPTLKGGPTLVRAVARLLAQSHRDWHILFVGDPRQYGTIKRLARWTGIRRHITFVGRVDDVRADYAAADIFAYPTRADACATVVMEAMAAGLPVVTSNRAGSHELITPGVDGYVLDDPNDDEQLAHLLRSCGDPALRRKMGRAARKTIAPHTFEQNCESVLGVYSEILAARPGNRRRIRHSA